MLRDRSTRAGLLICVTCMVVQQFSGINNAFNFSTPFLSANGIDAGTITIIAILMNVGNVRAAAARPNPSGAGSAPRLPPHEA